jgi:SAM-dependent methyltransferase/uncharacterized protein YbaR (Trm112 family)
MSAVPPPPFVCPACRVRVQPDGRDALRCDACGRAYPVVAGIPDLRLAPDRYLSFDDDRAKARELDALGLDFAGTVHAYWERTPEVPAPLARRYVASALAGVDRAQVHLRELGPVEPGEPLLDAGCGTGGLLVAAALAGACVVGVDIALRWLVVARRALDEAGVRATLAAADAARLPFAPGSFATCMSIEAVEHTDDQAGFVAGCITALAPGGRAYVVAANRTSVAVEPTTNLWGAGFLPRRLAARYVAWRRNTRAQWFRPVTARELRAFAAGARDVRVEAAPLPASPQASDRRRRATSAYDELRRGPLAPLVRAGAPYLELRASGR